MGFEHCEDVEDLGTKIHEVKIKDRAKELKALPFIDALGDWGFQIKGTKYVLFLWRGIFSWDDVETGEAITFEEVWNGVDEELKSQMIFHFNLLR